MTLKVSSETNLSKPICLEVSNGRRVNLTDNRLYKYFWFRPHGNPPLPRPSHYTVSQPARSILQKDCNEGKPKIVHKLLLFKYPLLEIFSGGFYGLPNSTNLYPTN